MRWAGDSDHSLPAIEASGLSCRCERAFPTWNAGSSARTRMRRQFSRARPSTQHTRRVTTILRTWVLRACVYSWPQQCPLPPHGQLRPSYDGLHTRDKREDQTPELHHLKGPNSCVGAWRAVMSGLPSPSAECVRCQVLGCPVRQRHRASAGTARASSGELVVAPTRRGGWRRGGVVDADSEFGG